MSVCVCVALCLSGFLTACLNLSAMPASFPHSKVCQHTLRVLEGGWMRVQAHVYLPERILVREMHEYVLHDCACVCPISSRVTFNSLMNDVMLWAVL